MAASNDARTSLLRVTPMLAVRDLAKTTEYYTKGLGFSVNGSFGDPPVWCSLQRDDVMLFFNQPPVASFPNDWPGHVAAKSHPPYPQPRRDHPTEQIRSLHIFYLQVTNLMGLHAELTASGLNPTSPRVTIYGMKEFELRDPDGYWLWFGEETNEPCDIEE